MNFIAVIIAASQSRTPATGTRSIDPLLYTHRRILTEGATLMPCFYTWSLSQYRDVFDGLLPTMYGASKTGKPVLVDASQMYVKSAAKRRKLNQRMLPRATSNPALCIPLPIWLRSRTTPTRTLVQVEGRALRMRSDAFLTEVMEMLSPLNEWIARYTHSFLAMPSQTAACNRLHNVHERLCRWLKMSHDRIRRDRFSMRQEFIVQMLGVHRPSISLAANILQKAGLIRYNRGEMEILDGLREGACECYRLMEKEMERLFGQPWRLLVDQDRQG